MLFLFHLETDSGIQFREYLWALDHVQAHGANATGILMHAVTQMDLEDIKLSEVDQTQRTDIV